MTIENLTRPGQAPQEGDWVRVTRGALTHEYQHHENGGIKNTVISLGAFLCRFMQVERVNIYTSAKTDPDVEDWVTLVKAFPEVDIADPRTIAGVNFLVSKSLLTQQRANEILAQ